LGPVKVGGREYGGVERAAGLKRDTRGVTVWLGERFKWKGRNPISRKKKKGEERSKEDQEERLSLKKFASEKKGHSQPPHPRGKEHLQPRKDVPQEFIEEGSDTGKKVWGGRSRSRKLTART